MCSSSPPAAPNYAAAAATQGAANVQTAIAQSLLNRPSEITPYGTRSWTQTGKYTIPSTGAGVNAIDIPLWESSIDMTDLGKQTFDKQQQISNQMGDMALSGLDKVQQATSTPFGLDSSDAIQAKAEEAIFSRLNPQLERYRDQQQTNLMTRGHNPQNESYGAQMQQVGQQENDARLQGILKAISIRPQVMQEELALRNQPLNELNALRTGAQVNLPQFNATQAGQIGQTPIFAAAQADGNAAMQAYNAEAAQSAGLMGGLFGLGGALMGAPSGGLASKFFGFG